MATSSDARGLVRYIVAAVSLLLLLVGLVVAYVLLTRPPALKEATERDRKHLLSIYGFEGDLLRRPSSVAIGPNGDIYVADTGKKRIVVFDADGKFVTNYGDFGELSTQLWEPLGIAVAPDGRSYVLDKSRKKIVVFDATKKPVKVLTFEELPLSVRVANGDLFVTTESGVLIGDLDGGLQTGYIKRGKQPGEFDRPGGVAVGPDGTLYIADSLNYRVQAIGTDGKPKWQYGKPVDPTKLHDLTKDTGQVFGLPASIAIDDSERLYVVDGLNSEIKVLSAEDGSFIERIGDIGHDDGKFYYPDGVAYADGKLVVADKFNDRIEIFSVPQIATGLGVWTPYLPWFLLLLVPLPFLLLLRRGTRYVMTPGFLEALKADPDGAVVARSVKSVFAVPTLAAVGKQADGPELAWREIEPKEERVLALADEHGVRRAEAEALALVERLRGRRVLLTEDPDAAEAAARLGVAAVSFEEPAAALGQGDASQADAAADDAGDGAADAGGDADA